MGTSEKDNSWCTSIVARDRFDFENKKDYRKTPIKKQQAYLFASASFLRLISFCRSRSSSSSLSLEDVSGSSGGTHQGPFGVIWKGLLNHLSSRSPITRENTCWFFSGLMDQGRGYDHILPTACGYVLRSIVVLFLPFVLSFSFLSFLPVFYLFLSLLSSLLFFLPFCSFFVFIVFLPTGRVCSTSLLGLPSPDKITLFGIIGIKIRDQRIKAAGTFTSRPTASLNRFRANPSLY